MSVELYSTLPITFYIVMIELIVGTAISMLIVEIQLEVGPGFLQFMGGSILATLLLIYWAASGFEPPVGTGSLAAFGIMAPLTGAVIASILYLFYSFRPRRLPRIAAGVALTGTSALALAAGLAGYAPMVSVSSVIASFSAASLVMGASMTAMLLGHWYLVAPMLSSRPLLRLTSLFILGLVAQGVVLVWLVNTGPESLERFGIIIWIRAAFGIIIPLIMAGFVWYSCRIRAMRTATGILYLAVGCVVMGDISAKVLYFLTTIPV